MVYVVVTYGRICPFFKDVNPFVCCPYVSIMEMICPDSLVILSLAVLLLVGNLGQGFDLSIAMFFFFYRIYTRQKKSLYLFLHIFVTQKRVDHTRLVMPIRS